MDEMIQQCTQMMSSMGSMMGGMMSGGTMTGWAGWASPWYWLGWVFVLATLIILIAFVWALRDIRHSILQANTPLEVLKRRYARGDIDAEKFETIKRQLAER